MPARIRARYANGVLTPLDPVDLQEGVELALAIDTAQPEIPSPADADKRRRQTPDDAWDDVPTDLAKDQRRNRFSTPKQENAQRSPSDEDEPETLIEMIQRVRDTVPPGAWDHVPPDFVRNKKHYLYGHPKQED